MKKKQIKLCGINDTTIIKKILDYEYQPDYLGFVFYHKSPRNISYKQAQSFKHIEYGNCQKIAVTVNPDFTMIEKIIENLDPDYIQLHGNETLEYCEIIKSKFKIKIIKALAISDLNDLDNINIYQKTCDMLLLDSKTEGYGGSAIKIDAAILDNVKSTQNLFISGGLNLTEINKLINKFSYFDISSGIELQKGVKDPKKINAILDYFKKINAEKK
jgi:phosphoribosylanthranilate isomerase